MDAKENAVRHSLIGFELLPCFSADIGGVKRNKVARFLSGKDSKRRTGFHVHKGGSHDPVIRELQGPTPQFDTGDMSDGVCSTAIHFNVDKELLDLDVLSRIFQPDETTPEYGHSHTKRLPGHKWPWAFGRGRKKFFKILHFLSYPYPYVRNNIIQKMQQGKCFFKDLLLNRIRYRETRMRMAKKSLKKVGHKEVYRFPAGFFAWKGTNYPVANMKQKMIGWRTV